MQRIFYPFQRLWRGFVRALVISFRWTGKCLRRWFFADLDAYVLETLDFEREQRERLETLLRETLEERIRDIVRLSFKELKNNTIGTIVGAIQTVYDCKVPGHYGGWMSLRQLRPGEELELSLYTYDVEEDAERFRFLKFGYEDLSESPSVVVPEFWAPYGAKVMITQIGGMSHSFPYSFYCR